MPTLQQFTADHRLLKEIVARQAGFIEPVLVEWDPETVSLVVAAKHVATLPIDGVCITGWARQRKGGGDRALLGIEVYEVEKIRFALVCFYFNEKVPPNLQTFVVVDRDKSEQLRDIARRLEPRPKRRPVLTAGQADLLWQNTIGYLEPANLARIERYGGRAHRGILLSGPPGNGKTMACRWISDECADRGWEARMVTPDRFRAMRQCGEVDELFRLDDRGVIFFDDMDQALRDRRHVADAESQSVFLTALDGMRLKQGVVFVFTSNCPLEDIDRAFKRPGRIDVALPFKEPDAEMRRELVQTWHAEIRDALDEQALIDSTNGYSFSEMEEIKNLLVMGWLDRGTWDWSSAMEQFEANRQELSSRRQAIGFNHRPASR